MLTQLTLFPGRLLASWLLLPVPSEWRLDFAGPPNLITEPAGKTEWKTTPSTTAHSRESQESDIGVATSHKKVAFSVLGMRAQKPM